MLVLLRRGINESIKNSELLNSKLPHLIDNWSKLNNSKLIHFSTIVYLVEIREIIMRILIKTLMIFMV